MVHIVGNTGQLANQLFRFAHHLANAIEYNYTISHHAFDYTEHFPNLTTSRIATLHRWPKLVNQLLRKLLPYVDKLLVLKPVLSLAQLSLISIPFEFVPINENFLRSALYFHTIATDWHFRDYTNFSKHAETLRRLFEPIESIKDKTTKCINALRSEYNILVGIHIRRGDYRHWENGRFYYDDSVYARLMQLVVDLHPTQNLAFIICSNEAINKESFANFNIFIPQNTFIEDITLLSQCDKIIGPPSSFSGWASFVGNTPLYYITDSSKCLQLTDFSVVMG